MEAIVFPGSVPAPAIAIDRSSESSEKWTLSQVLYSCAVAFFLFRYIFLMFFYKEPMSTPAWIVVLQLITIVSGIVLGKMWKSTGFRILMAYFTLIFFRVLIGKPDMLFDIRPSEYLLHGLWVFGACYSLGRILKGKQILQFLKVFAAIWTLGTMIHACLGIYTAWKGILIYNLSGENYWGLQPGHPRLHIVYQIPVSGALMSISAMIAFWGAISSKKWISKILFLTGMAVLLLALSLTDARAAEIGFSAGIGVIVFTWLYHLIRQGKTGKLRTTAAWVAGIAAMLVLMVGLIIAFGKVVDVFNKLKAGGGLLVSVARAEGEKAIDVMNRGYSGNLSQLLNGRFEIWQAVFRAMWKHPASLLWGESLAYPMGIVNAEGNFQFAHTHSTPIEIFLESGIPGVLLIGSFLVYTLVCAARLILSKGIPLWQRFLPVTIAVICSSEMVECIARLSARKNPNCSLFFLLMGIICALGCKEAIRKRTSLPDSEVLAKE